MRMLGHHGVIIMCAVAAGCWNENEPALPDGNETLGIVKFVEEEVADHTTLRGYDASGTEVAHLDLVHGHFKVTPGFDEYITAEVDGRKLTALALGQTMFWETAGFEPVLHMPAHPPTQWKLAAFLDDPHAKRILDKWQIGFEPFQGVGDGEVAFTSGNFRGDSPMNCDGATECGTGGLGTIFTCGGGGASFQADRVTQQPGSNCGLYTGPTNPEIRVAQCCPYTTGILGVDWFAQKVCPTGTNSNTSCGTVPSGACKGCAGYPIEATQTCSTGTGSSVGTCGSSVYQLDFSYTATTYTYVKASNTDPDDSFGNVIAVSSDGNTVAIGAYQYDGWSGGVYVFVYTGGSWSQQAFLEASNVGSQGGIAFGGSLSLSDDGNTLAVGAASECSNATGINGNQTNSNALVSGAVYVFTRSGTVWTQQAYIKATNTETGDFFGWSVSLSSDGNTLAVTASDEDSNATGIGGSQSDNSATNSGAVYVLTRSGSTWSHQAYIKASNTGANDRFGHATAVSDDGNTLVVGAWYEDSGADGVGGNQADDSAPDAGAAYVFTRSGTTWTQQAYLKASASNGYYYFGEAVSIAGDGNTIAAGSSREGSVANNSGAAYIFTRSGTTWSQQALLKASNAGDSDAFGYSVSVSTNGNRLAVGARWEDSSATGMAGDQSNNSAAEAGAVYRFTRVGSTWSQDRYIKATNTEATDKFGSAVVVSGDGATIVVGAPLEDSNATGIGGNQADNSEAQSGACYILR